MPNIAGGVNPISPRINTFIKDEISLVYNETPKVEVFMINENVLINVNFEDASFRIDKTFECKIPVRDRKKNKPHKYLMQVYLGIPARDMHYEDLKEMFTIVFKAYFAFKTIQKYKNQQNSQKAQSANSQNSQQKDSNNAKTSKETNKTIIIKNKKPIAGSSEV